MEEELAVLEAHPPARQGPCGTWKPVLTQPDSCYNQCVNSDQEGLRSLAVGCYAWLTAVFFGATLLDRVYSKALSDNPGALKSTTVFSDVSDFLLLIGFVTILAAIGAIVFAWRSAAARSLFIASILVLSLEFLTPIIFSAFVPDGQTPSIGPWLRIIPSGLASVLAYAGLLHR